MKKEKLRSLRKLLYGGVVIPAHPLALDSNRKIDERRQRALTRYYLDSGAGGIAIGVHTTQFAIREHGMFKPLLKITMEEILEFEKREKKEIVKIAGALGPTKEACREAEIAAGLGYDAVLLKLGGFELKTEDEILSHCKEVAGIIPLFGFYLQPALGGIYLSHHFWRRFIEEIDNLLAIKIATFNRYYSIDVVRALSLSGRNGEVSLYTGNDDNIILDLITPHRFSVNGKEETITIRGGLLGQWAVWTSKAVEILEEIKKRRPEWEASDEPSQCIPASYISLNSKLTDADGAIFDASHNFRGTIPGVLEVLRRQGFLEGIWCLDPKETLSPGQAEEITRVIEAYPELTDDEFVKANLNKWLS